MGIHFRRVVTLLVALSMLLVGCGKDSAPLTGVVLDQYTQNPIVGAQVAVGKSSTTTNEQGSWTVTEWSATDSIVIQATDYASSTLNLATMSINPQATEPLTMNMNLRPNTLSGVVRDEYTGQPLPNVQVQASTGLTTTTGPDGSYKLTNLPEAFEVTVMVTDYTSATQAISRSTSLEQKLRPTVLTGTITDKYTSKPLSGVELSTDTAKATTDAEGRYRLDPVTPDQAILISASDYTSQTLKVPAGITLDATLRPSTVRGTVVDAETGQPVDRGAVLAMVAPFAGADPTKPYTGSAVTLTRVSEDGTYELEGVPENAQIQVLVPGYRKALTTFAEGEFTADVQVTPFVAKAIYVTAATASSKDALTELFDLADRTEINAMVIDVKLDIAGNVGGIGYMSNHPLVVEAGTSEDYLDMAWIVEEAHKRDIYLIGRMAVMRDNRLADAKPEWAATSTETGEVWEDHGGLKWLDPFNHNVTEYNVGLAEEIAAYGFDEVQFDYIRFPSDGSTSNLRFSQPIDPENNPEVMYEAIGNVLEEAHGRINGSGAFFSIDVFGYATWRNMWEIGQSLEMMADHTDYVCAMVYPSHYDRNELGFDNADAHPYEIVKDSIEKGEKRMEGKYALQRPWLQAFTAIWLEPTVSYGREEVRAQMQAVAEVEGTRGWTLWNAANSYDEDWLDQ